jgi:hypothetical protein
MNYEKDWQPHVDAYRRFYAMEGSGRIAQDYWQVGAALRNELTDDRRMALTILHYVLMELVIDREIPV